MGANKQATDDKLLFYSYEEELGEKWNKKKSGKQTDKGIACDAALTERLAYELAREKVIK